MNWKLLALLVVVSPVIALAEGRVTQVVRDAKRATVVFDVNSEAPHTGDIVTAEGTNGEACEGKVTSIKAGKYSVDFAGCSTFSQIKAGSVVTMSADTTTAPAASVAPAQDTTADTAPTPTPYVYDTNRRLRFALAGYYNGGNELSFDSVYVSTGSGAGNGKIAYEMDGSLGFAVEGVYSPEQSWGFIFGLSHDSRKKLTKVKIEDSSSSQTIDVIGDAYLSITHLYTSAVYRWESFYIPFGLNYSIFNFKDEPIALSGTNGRLGIQLGIGWFFTDNFAVEITSRASSAKGGSVTSGSNFFDLGSGVLSSGQLTAKYVF